LADPPLRSKVFWCTALAKTVSCKLHTVLSATYEANIAQIAATISFKCLDFHLIVGNYHLVPVQPKSPALGHGIAHFNVNDSRSFPVLALPIRRMQTPEILSPPLAKMLRRRPLDFSHQPGACNPNLAARYDKPR
jgi:hypothetical protein